MMIINSRSILSAIAALTVAGAVLWGFTALFGPQQQPISTEVTQLAGRSWSGEMKQVGRDSSTPDAGTDR